MGLKENVIVGRLIPAGTGALMNRLKALAATRDKQLQTEQEPTAALPPAADAAAKAGARAPAAE